ncbi:hypothetical protein BC830DRAFT_81847 [Chytriomyces sp. MP71]|nr:hypothetical protein BC830DRAFT_81847 [Chytriomyces sp. MP71]
MHLKLATLMLAASAMAAPAKRDTMMDLFGNMLNDFGKAAKTLLGQADGQVTGKPVNANSAPFTVLFAPAAPRSASDAFSNFANHVYGVSASILGLSTAQGADQIKALGNIGYSHEALEAIEAMKMASENSAATNGPLQFLIQNTPCILNGMKSAALNPTPQNALYVAQQMSIVRDALILPNILNMGAASGAANLLYLQPTGPILGQGQIDVQDPGSATVVAAQQALGCSSMTAPPPGK